MGKIRVADGTLVDPYNLTPHDIKLDVFAHSLSQINRFTGHAKFPFSVGKHTLNLCQAMRRMLRHTSGTLPWEIGQAALAHDMSEVFFNDLSSPVKRENPDYRDAEHRAGMFIMTQLGISREAIHAIDEFDKRIYKNERTALFPVIGELGMGDDLVPLRDEWLPNNAFREDDWRCVRAALWYAYEVYFLNYTNFVPFWERDEFRG